MTRVTPALPFGLVGAYTQRACLAPAWPQMLREVHGCMLPVEVAWIKEGEMDGATLAALAGRYAPLAGLDLSHAHQAHAQQAHARPNTTLWGWQAKAFALLHTRFVQVSHCHSPLASCRPCAPVRLRACLPA